MNVKVLSYQGNERALWWSYYSQLPDGCKGVYHRPDFICLLSRYAEISSVAELFIAECGNSFIYYPYIKRIIPGSESAQLPRLYFDIVSSWSYGGPLSLGADAAMASAFRKRFIDYCRQSNIVSEFIRFDPYLGNEVLTPTGIDILPNREIVWVDLNAPLAAIVDQYEAKCRNRLRVATRQNVQIDHRGDESCLPRFVDIYQLEMERKGAPAGYRFPLSFFEELLTLPGCELNTILLDDQCIGGNLVLENAGGVSDFLRASSREYWSFAINDFLVHCSIKSAHQRNYRFFDLQGGRPGVFTFKKKFSRLRKVFKVGQGIHLPDIYHNLAQSRGRAVCDFFPAYRAPTKNSAAQVGDGSG